MQNSIEFDGHIFALNAGDSSYLMGLAKSGEGKKYLGHIGFVKRVSRPSGADALRTSEYSFISEGKPGDKCTFMDGFPFEYPAGGVGDFRENALEIENEAGCTAAELVYVSHRVYDGKEKLAGLPATFGDSDKVKTLEITLTDEVLSLDVILMYSIFEERNVVVRSAKLFNRGEHALYIRKALSACLEFDGRDKELITLPGSWARERYIDRQQLGFGRHIVGSKRGISSHQDHPFIAVLDRSTTQESGELVAMNFVYSGCFMACAEVTQHNMCRMLMGLGTDTFKWKLESGAEFTTPEVVVVRSSNGLDEMTHDLHELYRDHLIRSPYLHKKRPILINNWEATYFNFNEEKLLDIAWEAKKNGIEMLVMDDGWFGVRGSDNCSLGDWKVDRRKLPDGVDGLCRKVNEIGLEMGIWFEPEMISPDSDLYRAHPDWALQIPGREPQLCRTQFVLDITRKEVRDYVYESVATVLRSSNIRYVKWDMNRPLTDLGSSGLPADRQGEITHRYMLAVYELQERLLGEFPELLLENCTSGGGRFDPGMLFYSPQFWCSDDTDAMERLYIQEGTMLLYPLSTMGAHVSDCPNHIVGRTTDFEVRGMVALAGTFGYELDITRISDDDRAMISDQVAMYHKYNDLVREGDYYRIASARENGSYDCWEVVSKDKTEVLVTFIRQRAYAATRPPKIRLKALSPERTYTLDDGRSFYGDTLMNLGMVTDKLWGDNKGKLYHFTSNM